MAEIAELGRCACGAPITRVETERVELGGDRGAYERLPMFPGRRWATCAHGHRSLWREDGRPA